MSTGEAEKRGPRRGRESITKNRAGNWQVRYTYPDGKHPAGGTFRTKADADAKLSDFKFRQLASKDREFASHFSAGAELLDSSTDQSLAFGGRGANPH